MTAIKFCMSHEMKKSWITDTNLGTEVSEMSVLC